MSKKNAEKEKINKEIGERKKISAEARELEKNINAALKNIPMEFKSSNFSHIAVVARALKKKEATQDLSDLTKHYNNLSAAVSDIVDVNYKGFNKSIRNFSDILHNLNSSYSKITKLEADILSCQELLASRADDLSQLYATYLQHTEFLKILNEVEEIKGVPAVLEKAIEGKHFLYAVKCLEKYEEMLSKKEIVGIKALREIAENLQAKKKGLPELLIDELNGQSYNTENDIKDATQMLEKKQETVVAPTVDKNAEIDKSITTRIRRSTIKKSAAPTLKPGAPVAVAPSKPSSSATVTDQIDDDLSIDPKLDSSFYMKLLIESLDRLKQLPQAQSRLIQGLRFELRSVMDGHISTFAKTYERHNIQTLTSEKLSIDKNPMQAFVKSLQQGQVLSEMIKGLFVKLRAVLKNFRYIIDVMSGKFDKKTTFKSETSNSFDISFNIKVSTEVLSRLRDAVRIKLDSLRSEKRSDTVYISALEDLLFNFIEKDANRHLQSMKVSSIPDMFWGMVRTQIILKHNDESFEGRYMYIKQNFNNLLGESLSSPDTPRFLTIEHIWRTIQDELKSVLKDLLGITSEELEEQDKKEQEKKEEKKAEKSIRFRFGANIEYDTISESSEEKTSKGLSATFSSLSSYFVFSPYNMIWMYRPIKEFTDEAKLIVENALSTQANNSNASGNLAILSDFVNDAIKNSLIPRVRSDYRARLNQFDEAPDAFRPKEYLNTKTTHVYSSDEQVRPLINSVIQVSKWIFELYQFSHAIPPCKKDFYETMELLLNSYIEKCKDKFRLVISSGYGGFARQCFNEGGDIFKILRSDPNWKQINAIRQKESKLQNRYNIDITDIIKEEEKFDENQEEGFEPKDFEKNMREIADKPLAGDNADISKYSIVNDSSGIIMLCNLNDSLEWLADQLANMTKYRAQLLMRRDSTITGGNVFDELKQNYRFESQTSVTSNVMFSLMMLDDNTNTLPPESFSPSISDFTIQNTFPSKTLEDIYKKILSLANRCLFALKLDLRAHCYYYLDTIRTTNYFCEEDSMEPNSFAKNLNQDLLRVERCHSMYLSSYKTKYLFDGISHLISEIILNALSKMKKPRFNKLGIAKIKRDIFAIQQNITNITMSTSVQSQFNRVVRYYELLELTEKEYFTLLTGTEAAEYTVQQYKAILKTETHLHGIANEGSKPALILNELLKKFVEEEIKQAKKEAKPKTPTTTTSANPEEVDED